MKKLFTDRHGATKARTAVQLDAATRDTLLNLVQARMDEEWFGRAFPEKCRDGHAYAGTDFEKLEAAMAGYQVLWPRRPIDADNPPSDGQVFDLIEFAYEHLAEALDPEFHSYWSHSHYRYDQATGREKFATDVNRIFERNGMAFQLADGEITRQAPAILDVSLGTAVFRTGDSALDSMLDAARQKFLHRDLIVRREALEKLWDAWERLKTLEPGKDKRASTTALLDRAATEANFRAVLENEARQLTELGNHFMIRHTEVGKVPITESAQVDYLFHRLFALTRLLLLATVRGG